jgi:heme-degrading monooxygenase HmoA
LIALLTRVSIVSGRMDQALRIIDTSVRPTLDSREGFRGLFMLADREGSELVSLSLWEDAQSLEAIEQDGFADRQASKLSTVIAGPITGEVYEVAQAPQPAS